MLNVILGYIVFVTVPIFFTYFMLNFFVAQVNVNMTYTWYNNISQL